MGIYSHVYIVKITLTFTKVFYPKLDQVLKTHGAELVQNNKFVNILLKFYNLLIE